MYEKEWRKSLLEAGQSPCIECRTKQGSDYCKLCGSIDKYYNRVSELYINKILNKPRNLILFIRKAITKT